MSEFSIYIDIKIEPIKKPNKYEPPSPKQILLNKFNKQIANNANIKK